jgi:hypothetical protein
MNIGIKYTIELKPFVSVLFIKTYYAIQEHTKKCKWQGDSLVKFPSWLCADKVGLRGHVCTRESRIYCAYSDTIPLAPWSKA